MKPNALKQLQEAISTLTFTAGNMGQYNLDDTREDIKNALKAINSAIFIETPSTSTKFNLYKFTASEKMRPSLTGVFHDGGYCVACDSHVLAAVKQPYDEALEGKIIDKTGEEIKGYKYPKWRCVIPEKLDEYTEVSIPDRSKVYELLKEYKAEKKAAGRFGTPKQGYVKIGPAYFPVERFAKICTFMDAYGANSIQVDERRGALITAPDGSLALIMPTGEAMGKKEDGGGYERMHPEILYGLHRDAALWCELA